MVTTRDPTTGELFDDGASHVLQATDYQGTSTRWEDADQSTTRGTPTSQPASGARIVTIALLDVGAAAATANALYVVFNSANDTAAGVALAAEGRYVVALDERRTWVFPKGSECTRIDYLTDVAETNNNLVAGEYIV